MLGESDGTKLDGAVGDAIAVEGGDIWLPDRVPVALDERDSSWECTGVIDGVPV